MNFENRDTQVFMYLIKTFVADKHNYMLNVNEFYKTDPTKTLLGYYDEEYIYIIPSVVIGMCDDYLTKLGKPRVNIQTVLNTLFRANLIKVGWVMRKDLRYRPEKRVGGKRRRYITFIRKEMRNRKGTIDA
ncbi:hypothetical protein SAMN02910447_03285 [Ruminococcus sp. YE71]|uniref:hypothetical protein n=1 Tax=unclassified Ruminococcus TaxID=2608920 RepID=UPI0008907A6F|nr:MULTISPECIES: hypothetical protein [unclassified Ruminococcus]SDA30872.1 hypothetical protein SAMN02910446_03355 [Ruminococcus sp. YE78]SFW50626.1 hypothetical protein SAMN02910447_03285 [Ruminococcus sp. YE71]